MPSFTAAVAVALVAPLAFAVPLAPVSEYTDGQPQATVAAVPVSEYTDGQPQATVAASSIQQVPVSVYTDGQPQVTAAATSVYASGNAPATGVYVSASYSVDSAAVQSGNYLATKFGPDSQVPASAVTPQSAPPLVVQQNGYTSATYHGPYTGTATVTGAANGPATLAASIAPAGPNPTATYYNTAGKPLNPLPAPYTPAGGLGTNGSLPRYQVESDFDYESIQLGLYQEWIELDLFHDGLARFSDQDFIDAGLTAADRSLIQFMANQEANHATLLTNMLGETAAKQCYYNYPYTTVREFVDFNQRLTRWGESGVWGFINHLDSREVGQLLAQSIATEARQQMIFRQMAGLTPMDVSFETGYPQSWAWSLLAPYISYCPEGTTRLAWQNFPALHIVNNANINRFSPNDTQPNEVTGPRAGDPSISRIPEDESCENLNNTGSSTGYGCGPAVAHNKSEPLSFPGKEIFLQWDVPGMAVGPNNSYVTSTAAGAPAYAAYVSQFNVTYAKLENINGSSATIIQPEAFVYETNAQINGTMVMLITDALAPGLNVTPFNLSMINPHVNALGIYMAG